MADLEKLKRAPDALGIHEMIAKRWSPRAFADKAVSKQDLRTIFNAAGWAASSYNEQPWRFLVGIKGDEEHGVTYDNILNSLGEFNQAWAKAAPVLVATIAKKTFSHNGSPNSVAKHDVGAASATMCLQAIALGIHSHGMAGFDSETLRAFFGIPSDFEPVACWALGYLGDPETLSEHYRQSELETRGRREFEDYVFINWEEGAQLE